MISIGIYIQITDKGLWQVVEVHIVDGTPCNLIAMMMEWVNVEGAGNNRLHYPGGVKSRECFPSWASRWYDKLVRLDSSFFYGQDAILIW